MTYLPPYLQIEEFLAEDPFFLKTKCPRAKKLKSKTMSVSCLGFRIQMRNGSAFWESQDPDPHLKIQIKIQKWKYKIKPFFTF